MVPSLQLLDSTAEQASGKENLGSWDFSDGGSLPDCKVWVDARKAGDRRHCHRATSEMRIGDGSDTTESSESS